MVIIAAFVAGFFVGGYVMCLFLGLGVIAKMADEIVEGGDNGRLR